MLLFVSCLCPWEICLRMNAIPFRKYPCHRKQDGFVKLLGKPMSLAEYSGYQRDVLLSANNITCQIQRLRLDCLFFQSVECKSPDYLALNPQLQKDLRFRVWDLGFSSSMTLGTLTCHASFFSLVK